MAKEKTQFKPGNSGRPKGSKNKSLTRSKIAEILNDPSTWVKFHAELKKLKGKAYHDIVLKTAEFETPRYSAINLSLSNMPDSDLEYLISKLKEQMTHESESD